MNLIYGRSGGIRTHDPFTPRELLVSTHTHLHKWRPACNLDFSADFMLRSAEREGGTWTLEPNKENAKPIEEYAILILEVSIV